MDELVGTARNVHFFAKEDGTFDPLVEVVILMERPGYVMQGKKGLLRKKEVTAIRFTADPRQIEDFAGVLQKYAQEAQEYADRVNAKLKEPPCPKPNAS